MSNPHDHKIRVIASDNERITVFADRRGVEHVAPSLPWVWGDPELAGLLRWPRARFSLEDLSAAHVMRLLWHSLRAGQMLREVPEGSRFSMADVACMFAMDDVFGPLTVLTSIIGHSSQGADSSVAPAPAAEESAADQVSSGAAPCGA